MNKPAAALAERPTQRLSVERHHPTLGETGDGSHPLTEGLRERDGVQDREDPAERVVRRDLVRKIEERLQPCLLGLAEFLDGDEGVRSTNHGDKRQGKYARERMQPPAIDSRIRNRGEVLQDRSRRHFVHGGAAFLATHWAQKDHAGVPRAAAILSTAPK